MSPDVILKRFKSPDEAGVLIKGRFELVHIGGLTMRRGFQWNWSDKAR
jgi:hypothetical protein